MNPVLLAFLWLWGLWAALAGAWVTLEHVCNWRHLERPWRDLLIELCGCVAFGPLALFVVIVGAIV